jgi:threonine synthase
MTGFVCDHCARLHEAPPPLWRCPCGGPLAVAGRGRLEPGSLAGRPPTLWRYREALALDATVKPVSLGERITPLVRARVAGLDALFKLETTLPTGSFKDRGSCIVVSEMAARGVTAAVEDSSGNAGASMAAYGSRAGLAMHIVAPADAPAPKLAAIEACGGRLTRVPGPRDASTQEALRRASGGMEFASHVWNPWFLEGTRTVAWEIWEQMEGELPARMFVPVGNGSLLAGAAAGFADLVSWGLAARVPRMMGVQADGCAPFVHPGRPAAGTVADGIRIVSPPRARAIRNAVAGSEGEFLAVTDAAILDARAALGRAGLDVEPTAAVAFAGAREWGRRAPASGDREDLPVIALTGSGLKVA